MLLARVAAQIEIRTVVSAHVADELLAARNHHALVLDFGEGGRQATFRRRRCRQPRAKIGAAHARGQGKIEQSEDGRGNVDELGGPGNHVGGKARRHHDERHVDLLLEKGCAMVASAVLAEFLAVIGGHHDHGTRPLPFDQRHHLPHHRIGVGDFAVVTIHIAAPEVEAWMPFIRLVRLEKVQPQK